jgi:hypothetical protein
LMLGESASLAGCWMFPAGTPSSRCFGGDELRLVVQLTREPLDT